jgi:predicted Zn-dependent protease with MMP-like domain
LNISDKEFRNIVSRAIDSLPPNYIKNMKNVAIIVEDEPTAEQRAKLKLVNGMTLYGLYEGIPLIRRSGNYNLVLPDKITIFKNPILEASGNLADLKAHVKRVVWHEIGHHYGLSDDEIHKLEQTRTK